MEHKETCGMLVKQVYDAVGKKLNNSLRETGLTHVQLGVLIALEHTEEKQLRLKEIEKIFHVSQPTVVGVVDRLEEKGLIRTIRDPSDKRVRLAELTESGLEKCRHEYEVLTDTDELMVQGLSEKEQEELRRMLRLMRENLA
ncbi:MAG: MarR family transcriptional regulator [Lachnospiraceae bacterium]|nr:MarR family transcriptional regulator [Lachnospiraceae bacterium]